MKKALRILAATVVGMGMLVGTAAADTATCGQIINSGPGSTNYVYCENHTTQNVTCTNTIVLTNTNSQSSSSGNAANSGNTNSGNASSGNAGNDTSTSTTVNAGCQAVTPAASVTPSTPSTPAATTTPSTPATTTPAVVPTKTVVQAAALPFTGSDTVQNTALYGVLALAGVTVAAQLALTAYRRLAIK